MPKNNISSKDVSNYRDVIFLGVLSFGSVGAGVFEVLRNDYYFGFGFLGAGTLLLLFAAFKALSDGKKRYLFSEPPAYLLRYPNKMMPLTVFVITFLSILSISSMYIIVPILANLMKRDVLNSEFVTLVLGTYKYSGAILIVFLPLLICYVINRNNDSRDVHIACYKYVKVAALIANAIPVLVICLLVTRILGSVNQ